MVKIYFSAFFELPLLNCGVFVYNVDIWTFKPVSYTHLAINSELARQAREILELNKSERHIRGGLATREKYLHLHNAHT